MGHMQGHRFATNHYIIDTWRIYFQSIFINAPDLRKIEIMQKIHDHRIPRVYIQIAVSHVERAQRII